MTKTTSTSKEISTATNGPSSARGLLACLATANIYASLLLTTPVGDAAATAAAVEGGGGLQRESMLAATATRTACCWVAASGRGSTGIGIGSSSSGIGGAETRGRLQLGPFGPVRRRGMLAATDMVADLASKKARRKQNAEGNLFVDESCIDCDTCRWMQGDVFASAGGKSAVVRQPVTEEERRGAYRAMFACPTSSIRVEAADPIARKALTDFPFPVDTERLPGVYHLGFHDENSFGCSPWLIERADGNVMMDSPRFNSGLARALNERGGVSWMVMSHIDDVGDHERWKGRFPEMRRVLHKADVQRYGDTGNVEVQLDSDSADGQIDGFDFWDLAGDLRVLHTPGHSKGSITLLYTGSPSPAVATAASTATPEGFPPEDEGIAFTGDHLAFSGRTGALTGFPRYGFDLAMQAESMGLLTRPEVKFRWILPGHGRMIRFSSHDDRVSQIKTAAVNVRAGRP